MADTKDIQLTDSDAKETVTAKKTDNDTSALVDEPVYFPGFVAFEKRTCTDCLCLILFGLFLAGWMGLLGYGISKGRPEVLYRATDYEGNVCGEFLSTTSKNDFFTAESIKVNKKGAMPRLVDDFLLMATAKSNGTRITTVCTESCPQIDDIVCTYDFMKKLKDSTGISNKRKQYGSPLFQKLSTGDAKKEYDLIHGVLQRTSGQRRFLVAQNAKFMRLVEAECEGTVIPTSAPWLKQATAFGKTEGERGKQFCIGAFQACDKAIMNSTSILGRCVPYLNSPKTRIIQRCVDPVTQTNCNASDKSAFTEATNPYCINGRQAKYEPTEDADGNLVLVGKESELCAKMEEVTTSTQEVLPQSAMLKRMAALAASFSSYVVSVQRAWLPVLTCGLLLALVLGFVFLILIKTFAACIVWMSIVLLEVCLIAGAILGLMKGGVIKDGIPPAFTAAAQRSGFSGEVNDDNQTYYQIGGYVLAFMAIAFICVIIFVRRQINDAIRVVKISAKAVGSNPKVVLWPLFSFFWVGVSSAVFTILAILLMSSGDMIANEATAFLNDTALAQNSNLTNPSAYFPDVSTLKTDQVIKYFAIYDLFMWFWFNEFIQALGVFTIGGTIAEWYFTPKEYKRSVPEGQSLPRRICCPDTKHGVCGAFCIAFRKHSGTAAFGSLIIAIVSTIRTVVTYIQMQILAANKDNKLVKVIQCLIACCMKCVEKCAKYLTKNAFLYSSVKGTNLCVSAYKSFLLLWNNLVRFSATGMSSGVVMLFGKMFIMMLSVLAGYNWLNMGKYKDAVSSNYVSDMGQFVCCLVILFFSFVVSEVFFSVYDTATDTILLSYCFDIDQGDGKAFENKMGMPMPITKNLEGDKAGKEEKDGETKPCCGCGFK